MPQTSWLTVLDLAAIAVSLRAMRANYRMQRLFVPQPMQTGGTIEPDRQQAHYLTNVLRMQPGGQLLVFNGVDGEWLAQIAEVNKKSLILQLTMQVRPQPAPSDLVYCFAPLKVGRLDYLVQKAVEMGAGVLQPVITQHTQMSNIGTDRILANAIEAAEQCGILAIPQVREVVKLDRLIWEWDATRRLIYCDEGANTNNPVPALKAITEKHLGLLVGPEGGFSDDERRQLRALPYVTPIPLGPRILRADTAAVAALTLWQAALGDWR